MSLKNVQVHHFSQEEIVGLRNVFNRIDSNSDGRLTRAELLNFMQQSGMDTRFIDATFKVFDENKDDTLSFDEFLAYLDSCQKTESDPRYLFKLIFEAVDENKDGALSIEELMSFLKLCGQEMPIDQVKDELKNMDTDGNKKIDFDELCTVFGI